MERLSEDRQLGVDLYNDVWRLLQKTDRTPEENDEVVHQAHASAYHWLKAPESEPKNQARGEWLCSRVYAVLGRGEGALHHATRCLEITEQHADNVEDWDLPFAYEALARAHRVAGDAEESRRYAELARESGESIADSEDREHLVAELATVG